MDNRKSLPVWVGSFCVLEKIVIERRLIGESHPQPSNEKDARTQMGGVMGRL